MTGRRRRNRVEKACSPLIDTSGIRFGICRRFCTRLEANGSVESVNGTRVERLVSL